VICYLHRRLWWRHGNCNGSVAAHSICIGQAQLAFTRVGLDGHSARFGIFVNMDLDRRPAGQVPPGATSVRLLSTATSTRLCVFVGYKTFGADTISSII